MMNTISLGCKVRHRDDESWGSPGCVMSFSGDRLRIYWPDDNMFTKERPADLVAYESIACQSQEAVA